VVLDRTETAWRAAGYDVRRSTLPGWNVLSALGGMCMTTLQLAGQGAAFGYLAVGRAAPVRAGLAPAPLPPGATVLSTVASEDDGRIGTLTALTSGQTPEQLNAYYMRRLAGDHWSGVSAH